MKTKLTWKNDIVNEVLKATKEAVTETCEHILSESKKIAPIESGKLVESSGIDVTGAKKVEGAVFYSVDYAPRVHEIPDSQKNKFLENPLNSNSTKLIEALKSKLKI
jgi:hypothetical protein